MAPPPCGMQTPRRRPVDAPWQTSAAPKLPVLDDWGLKALTSDGSDTSGRRAAAIYTLIETAKLNGIDPQAWLADVLALFRANPPSRSPTCSLHLVTGRRMPPSAVRSAASATLSPAKS